jgi:putative component of toxin-antitoxin plasmid stabilization module
MGRAIGCISHSKGQTVVVLLAGGDKRTQDRGMELALGLAREL